MIAWLNDVLHGVKVPHVFTKINRGGWGNNWFFLPCEPGVHPRKVSGHLTQLPQDGDEFHAEMTSGMTGRYRAVKVKPCGDPPDMFFSDVEFVGYVDSEATPL